MAMDTILAVLAYIATATLAVVLGMIAAPTYVRTGKVLIWGSAIPFGLWGFFWEFATDAPMAIRIVVGLLIGAFVFVIVPEVSRWMSGLQQDRGVDTTKPTNTIGNVIGNSGILSQGQTGDNIQQRP